ncbi:MAG: phosphoglycerate kinase [Acidimicrobiaceae bacterium]|nr:phosphoglycerate kinase [Acidimicrobiaceae bacterium]
MSELPKLEDLGDISGKRVLVRTDFNVPLDNGIIRDDLRIREAIPTLKYLVDNGAEVTACTHLGRPKGKFEEKYSLDPIRVRLNQILPGIKLLDNLRFNSGEEANDPQFIEQLVAGQDIYVNDAFGASHRSHASITGPPQLLPSAAGRLLQNEVEILLKVRNKPKRPFVAILGGSKVSDKLGVIDALVQVVDKLLIGGGMCFTFLKAQGQQVGSSLLEEGQIDYCKELLASGAPIILPHDFTAMDSNGKIGDPAVGGTVRQMGNNIPDGWSGLDIGPGSAALFGDIIQESKTVLWNGPMGVFEDTRFSAGTKHVAQSMAENKASFTVIGGGDSAAAAKEFKFDTEIDHVSTGGGASLELIEKGTLPGIDALLMNH